MTDLLAEQEKQQRIEALRFGLQKIQQRGFTDRKPVPYLHKDDHNLGYFISDIKAKLAKQKPSGKLRLGIVVGTGALLSIAPEVNVDAWVVMDNNDFVLQWANSTVTAIRGQANREDYTHQVYQSPLAQEAQSARIDPSEWLKIEQEALGNLHFLSSDDRYAQARASLGQTPVLVSLGDLSNQDYITELARVVEANY